MRRDRDHAFDELARLFAAPRSRREVLRQASGLLLPLLFGSLGLTRPAWGGQRASCDFACEEVTDLAARKECKKLCKKCHKRKGRLEYCVDPDPGGAGFTGTCCPKGKVCCGYECCDLKQGICCVGNCFEVDPATHKCCTVLGENGAIGWAMDVTSDPLNCGDCGVECASHEICFDGLCEAICAPNQTPCGSNPVNCCDPGEFCVNGQCKVCPHPSQQICQSNIYPEVWCCYYPEVPADQAYGLCCPDWDGGPGVCPSLLHNDPSRACCPPEAVQSPHSCPAGQICGPGFVCWHPDWVPASD
jgi:hypothetical protein